jgi:hypothetical protein
MENLLRLDLEYVCDHYTVINNLYNRKKTTAVLSNPHG